MSLQATIAVSDVDRSVEFYDAVLAPLGWRRGGSGQKLGWGLSRPVFFIVPGSGSTLSSTRICFAARTVPAVKDAWQAALDHGGADDGHPGQRPEFGATYYCAFVRDPDGNPLELAVLPD